MKRAVVLLNGRAGNHYGRRNAGKILEMLGSEGYESLVLPVGPESKTDLSEYLKSYKDSFDVCVVVGGDGTLHHAINGMIRAGCTQPISYIPCGTTNDFAKSLGISTDLSGGAKIIHENTLTLDAGLFNKEYFTYVAAFGAFTDVSYSTPQDAKNALGYTAYALNSFQALPSGLSSKITASVESEEFTGKGTYIYGSVSNCYSVAGVKSPLLEHVTLDDGLFEVTLIRAPENIGELLEITGTLLSGDLSSKNNRHVRLFTTRKVTFTFEDDIEWTLDGEFGGQVRKAAISVKKKKLNLLR